MVSHMRLFLSCEATIIRLLVKQTKLYSLQWADVKKKGVHIKPTHNLLFNNTKSKSAGFSVNQ